MRRSKMGWAIMCKGADGYNEKCLICGEIVGDEQKFYYRNKVDVVHAGCAWEEEEKSQKRER